jgi:ribonucleoside-diphosphate reductase alpha chain
MKDLIKLGLWNDNMKNRIIEANGSVQTIAEIPTDIKMLYRTVWEISQKNILEMSAERGAYICQSQSLNIHMQDANFGKLTSMHFHAWKIGLKTGLYYLRTKAAADAIKFTVEKQQKAVPAEKQTTTTLVAEKATQQQAIQCSLDDPEGCEMCGS